MASLLNYPNRLDYLHSEFFEFSDSQAIQKYVSLTADVVVLSRVVAVRGGLVVHGLNDKSTEFIVMADYSVPPFRLNVFDRFSTVFCRDIESA